jgi:HK97 family phage major capsid protein
MQTQQWVDKAKSLQADLEKIMAVEEPTADDLTKATGLSDELKALETKITTAETLQAESAARANKAKEEKALVVRPPGFGQHQGQGQGDMLKTLGDLFVESKEYKGRNGRFSDQDPVSTELVYKTLITSGQVIGSTYRADLFQMLPQLPLSLLDLIPNVSVTVGSITYYQETVFTNAAGMVLEGGAKPESAKTFAPVVVPISKVAHWIPVTTECLADAPFIRSVIDSNLRYGVRQKIQQQVLAGTGTLPELRGLDNISGVQPVAFATDIPTTIMHAIMQIEAVGGTPTAIAMSAADWATVRLTVGGTPYAYLWGAPTDKGVMSMWGLPVVTVPGLPAGWAYVADWNESRLLVREDINVFTGLKNDDLIKNILTIVCEARVGFVVFRPAFFAKADLTALI